MDDDVGLDDVLGLCTIDLEDLKLGEKPVAVDKLIQGKKAGWFSKEGRIFLEISFLQD